MKENIYCKECNSYFSQIYYNYHKKTLKHIENDININLMKIYMKIY